MGDKTEIEWADATWNPIRARRLGTGMVGWACVRVSPGCERCYAERLNKQRGTGQDYTVHALQNVELFLDERMLTKPLRWTRPRRIFVCSMTDLFMEQVPDEWTDRIFAVMALARQHTFLVLTKRAERMQSYCSRPDFGAINEGARLISGSTSIAVLPTQAHGMVPGGWPLSNVWYGVSAEDQRRADERIPWLLKTPAVVRWLSLEPLLGPIDVGDWLEGFQPLNPDLSRKPPEIQWVIVGGESGGPPERALVHRIHHQRIGYQTHDRNEWAPKPEAIELVRSIRDQCVAAGVSFFHKQWGGPTAKSGGRLLDGRTWDEYPN